MGDVFVNGKGGAHGVGRLSEEFLRAQHVEPDEDQTSEAAALMVETGGAQVIEIFSPKRFAATAGDPGLRPGFAMDLCGTAPYGPNEATASGLEFRRRELRIFTT